MTGPVERGALGRSEDRGFDAEPQSGGRDADPIAFHRSIELLLYGVAPLATLATAPVLAHGLGPAGRGQYGVAIAVATLVATLGSWGQAEVFLSHTRTGTAEYRTHSRITWFGGVIAGAVCAAIMLVLDLPLSTTIATSVWVPLLTQIGLWRAASIAKRRLKAPALDSAVGPLLRLAALAVLAATALLTVDSAVFAFQAALGVGSLVTVGLAVRRSNSAALRSRAVTMPLLVSGTGIIVFNVLHAVTLRADLIILQLVSSPEQVGLYAAPAGLTTAALALSTAYRPRVQAAAFTSNPLRGMLVSFGHVALLGGLGTIALWLSTPLVIRFVFGSEFTQAAPIMRMLVAAIVPLLLIDLVFAGLVVLGRRRDLVFVAAGSATLNVGALLFFAAWQGAFGAAVATVLSYGLSAVMGVLVLVRACRRCETAQRKSRA